MHGAYEGDLNDKLASWFLFSMTNKKFSLRVCSFLGFSSVEIKSDDGYQIDGGYLW